MAVKKLLPYGVKDYYPPEVERLNYLLGEIEKELKLWGYREIKLPSLEYKELFETTLGRKVKDGFSVKDCSDGETLTFRYDFTPQIVRFVLHNRKRVYPLRIFYKGETYKSGRQLWEEPSVGFELVGASSVEADAEVVALIKTLFEKLGLKNYKVVIGHRGAYDYLTQTFGQEAVNKKLFTPQMAPYLKTYPLEGKGWENLNLPQEVLKELRTLRELLEAYQIGSENMLFAPGAEPERDYYSGIFFRFISQKGQTLARGGRYDRLFKRLKEDIPATGGGIKLLPLLESVEEREKPSKGVYIIDTTPDKVLGWKLAKLLREKGIKAERDIVARDIDFSVKAAKEKGYDRIVVIGKVNGEGIYVLDPQTGEEGVKDFAKELLKLL